MKKGVGLLDALIQNLQGFFASDPNGSIKWGAYIRPRDLSLITWA